uniref:(northern house mosquito) hypothetical protein n=1 Tax=Culex pipiens TaxID=7175 RepID=A0A8D8HJX2_CULPI
MFRHALPIVQRKARLSPPREPRATRSHYAKPETTPSFSAISVRFASSRPSRALRSLLVGQCASSPASGFPQTRRAALAADGQPTLRYAFLHNQAFPQAHRRARTARARSRGRPRQGRYSATLCSHASTTDELRSYAQCRLRGLLSLGIELF